MDKEIKSKINRINNYLYAIIKATGFVFLFLACVIAIILGFYIASFEKNEYGKMLRIIALFFLEVVFFFIGLKRILNKSLDKIFEKKRKRKGILAYTRGKYKELAKSIYIVCTMISFIIAAYLCVLVRQIYAAQGYGRIEYVYGAIAVLFMAVIMIFAGVIYIGITDDKKILDLTNFLGDDEYSEKKKNELNEFIEKAEYIGLFWLNRKYFLNIGMGKTLFKTDDELLWVFSKKAVSEKDIYDVYIAFNDGRSFKTGTYKKEIAQDVQDVIAYYYPYIAYGYSNELNDEFHNNIEKMKDAIADRKKQYEEENNSIGNFE